MNQIDPSDPFTIIASTKSRRLIGGDDGILNLSFSRAVDQSTAPANSNFAAKTAFRKRFTVLHSASAQEQPAQARHSL